MFKIILIVLSAVSAATAHADFSGGMGVFSHNILRTTTTADAEKSMLGTRYLPMILRYETDPVWGTARLAPYLSFTYLTTLLIPVETPDDTAKKNFAIFALPLVLPMGESWFLSGALGLMYYEIKGNGGTKQVANGTGTSTFGVPSRTVSSKLFLLELGTGWQLTNWRINLDLQFTGLLSERRSTSFQAALTYSFGGQRW